MYFSKKIIKHNNSQELQAQTINPIAFTLPRVILDIFSSQGLTKIYNLNCQLYIKLCFLEYNNEIIPCFSFKSLNKIYI